MKKTKKQNDLILITGGGGYIGSVLVEKLVNQGYSVRVFDKFYFGRAPLKYLIGKIEIVEGDIRRIPQNLFDNVGSIVHLASLSNDPTADFAPSANYKINTLGTKTLAQIAKSKGVKKFIFASSCSIYDEGLAKDGIIKDEAANVKPTAFYSASKYQAERELLNLADDNFQVIIFRNGTVFGFSSRMRYDLVVNTMVKNTLETGIIKVYCRGVQFRPLVDVEDVAKAYITALESQNPALNRNIINLALGNFQVGQVAKIVQKTLVDKFSIKSKIIFEQDEKLDRSYQVTTDKATKLLNFVPRTSIEKSVVKMVENIRKRGMTDFSSPIYYNIDQMLPLLKKELKLRED